MWSVDAQPHLASLDIGQAHSTGAMLLPVSVLDVFVLLFLGRLPLHELC